MAITCPVCQQMMGFEKGKLNLQVNVCAENHGAFVEPARLRDLVDDSTADRLRDLEGKDAQNVACPSCSTPMREVVLSDLNVDACGKCGGLWFDRSDLAEFQRGWRVRTYGENSIAARLDVLDEAQKLYAAEIISGVLTEFEMSITEE